MSFRVQAPGKLMLTGSYVVLEGAPALVMAVDRYAIADGSVIDPAPSAEIAAAMTRAPKVETSALYDWADSKSKLGLGSSAAALVAALGWEAADSGADLTAPGVRAALFEKARAAHAKAQGGGSGVDIAASVHGGLLDYRLTDVGPVARPILVPPGLVVEAWFSGRSARTSDMRAQVDTLAARDPATSRSIFADLRSAANGAATALAASDLGSFLRECRYAHVALTGLARASAAPIIPEDAAMLDALAEQAGSVFLPSGAGGGDVFVHVGLEGAARPFVAESERLGWKVVPLRIDQLGVSRQ